VEEEEKKRCLFHHNNKSSKREENIEGMSGWVDGRLIMFCAFIFPFYAP
jgi:hypothetical protein